MLKWFSKKELEQVDDQTFKPLDDLVYHNLLEEAAKGQVPVYFAAVPLNLIRPYEPEFYPEKTPVPINFGPPPGPRYQNMAVLPGRPILPGISSVFSLRPLSG